ncbi:MAG TPA: DUF1801 domain-containing protein [Ignavibacteria bacterium]|nr:DUF1801 domain-containing protein [Ignavibacteria bacterium]
MYSKEKTVDDYISSLPDERKDIISELRKVILKNLPKGFEEMMNYGMIGYVVPHSIYPNGYHCDPKLPLPFLNIASQKNHIAIYHMGFYDNNLVEWYSKEWSKLSNKKPDLGKSCLKFKKPEEVPVQLIGELAKKITPKEWIEIYESAFQTNKKNK